MAKKEKAKFDYAAELRELKNSGPARLYLLCGEEDYLRACFLDELKKLCIGDAPEEFNYRRLNGNPEPQKLFDAVESAPFCSERTLVEVKDFDINACRDAQLEQLKEIWEDIPDYCTLALLTPAGSEPDSRLGAVKAVKKLGKFISFEGQEKSALVSWIARRFAALGKKIGRREAEQLIFSAGGLMNQLMPEIEKIAAGVKGDTVTARDIDKFVQPLPEARVFDFTDRLAAGRFDEAAETLAELIRCREEPVKLLALIGSQLRRVYAVALAQEKGAGRDVLMELGGTRFDFVLQKLRDSARRFTLPQLRGMVELCAVYDYKLKSSGTDGNELLRELFAAMAARVRC
ncbi:MAG: DNA polymerase III subunit delta [Butyricicoccus sp.]|nr:DNA polymerase III subunit delta [Butyricicoccus sp.]